ncbi:hypothetical protein HPP92_010812 [Vanilla planifolia]|uniref:Uncharacterized protein n=1 Tax=Vanilla planifolia TaxID=51239 RepID=A0A835R344_VANPL|nr:hypothetical protein HPP92_010812 [Vanilla planifolia]
MDLRKQRRFLLALQTSIGFRKAVSFGLSKAVVFFLAHRCVVDWIGGAAKFEELLFEDWGRFIKKISSFSGRYLSLTAFLN